VVTLGVALQAVEGEDLEAAKARVADIMPRLMGILEDSSGFYAETTESLNALMKLVKTKPLVALWAVSNQEEFDWILSWVI